MDIADIPNLPSREERFEAITVDCYNERNVSSPFGHGARRNAVRW
jgi:hypothetical protein